MGVDTDVARFPKIQIKKQSSFLTNILMGPQILFLELNVYVYIANKYVYIYTEAIYSYECGICKYILWLIKERCM